MGKIGAKKVIFCPLEIGSGFMLYLSRQFSQRQGVNYQRAGNAQK